MSSTFPVRPGDRPAGWPQQTHSEVMSRKGMVATSHPLAAQAGLRILMQGGNAADAAVATAAALNVLEPMSTGVGGDMFAIAYLAQTDELLGLNGSGRAPAKATTDLYHSRGFGQMPQDGIMSSTVPGTVDGWYQLLRRAGTMNLAQVLQPAIEYAEEGFPVTQVIAWQWANQLAKLKSDPDSARTWLSSGKPPLPGSIFTNPGLGRTLRIIGENGRDGFYSGEIARAIVQKSDSLGGLFTLEDLASHTSSWVEPIHTNYRGVEVYELPPNGQGIAALEMLNVLEGYDLASIGRDSPRFWHLLVEAKKLAFADLAAHLTDPEFYAMPVERILSREYAAEQRSRIDEARASDELVCRIPKAQPLMKKMEKGDTVYLTVADRWGNMVSFINSLFNNFGSGVTVGDTGIVLQNRGGLFSVDPEHPNRIEPRKRPYHTIIPAFAKRDGKPWLSFGVMGGDTQPQGHVQVLINMIDFGMTPQAAGDAGRYHHSQTENTLALESDVESVVGGELARLGHRLVKEQGTFGGYQAIMKDPESGAYIAGSDHRKDGEAVGY